MTFSPNTRGVIPTNKPPLFRQEQEHNTGHLGSAMDPEYAMCSGRCVASEGDWPETEAQPSHGAVHS